MSNPELYLLQKLGRCLQPHSEAFFPGSPLCLAFQPTGFPEDLALEGSLGQPQSLWQNSRQPARRADYPAGSRALPGASLLTVCLPWHPARQLHLRSLRCHGFQNKGGSVFGATFGYKAVCTCSGHHHHCLDRPPRCCSDGLDCLWLSWDIGPAFSACGWNTHCPELTSRLTCLPPAGLHGKS